MLTYEDCVGLADLTEEEIAAVAQHEHLPEIIAMELADYLVRDPAGVPRIKAIIIDDIAIAQRRGDCQRVLRLKLVLQHFVQTHPASPSI